MTAKWDKHRLLAVCVFHGNEIGANALRLGKNKEIRRSAADFFSAPPAFTPPSGISRFNENGYRVGEHRHTVVQPSARRLVSVLVEMAIKPGSTPHPAAHSAPGYAAVV